MVGDGEMLEEIRERSAQRGRDRLIRFLGARRDVYRWMQVMDVLVMTSIIEGMPNVLIEAQFMGIPCVTTDAGGAREVVEDGRNGFVVPVRDIRPLVEQTRRLLHDPALRDRFSKAGRERAQKYFHVDRMVLETLQLYKDLTAGLPLS
jgi:glycosyltransferase involved in cell wall biosynthesis